MTAGPEEAVAVTPETVEWRSEVAAFLVTAQGIAEAEAVAEHDDLARSFDGLTSMLGSDAK